MHALQLSLEEQLVEPKIRNQNETQSHIPEKSTQPVTALLSAGKKIQTKPWLENLNIFQIYFSISYPRNRPWRPMGCEMLSISHCVDNRLTVNCEILATCSSTYSPVRTSQEEHSVSIK
jgi:hypothetical protein